MYWDCDESVRYESGRWREAQYRCHVVLSRVTSSQAAKRRYYHYLRARGPRYLSSILQGRAALPPPGLLRKDFEPYGLQTNAVVVTTIVGVCYSRNEEVGVVLLR